MLPTTDFHLHTKSLTLKEQKGELMSISPCTFIKNWDRGQYELNNPIPYHLPDSGNEVEFSVHFILLLNKGLRTQHVLPKS